MRFSLLFFRTSAHLFFSQATSNELQTQIASLRQRASASGSDPATAAKLSLLTARASTAERRVVAYQTQLASAEDKLGEARKKVSVAEGKWEARLRELETRLRVAEEKLKRERQGAKEKVDDLAATIECVSFPLSSGGCSLTRVSANSDLQNQVAGARRRDHQLADVLTATEQNKAQARKAGSTV